MRVLHGRRASDLLGGDRSANRHLYAVFNNARPPAGKAFDVSRVARGLPRRPEKTLSTLLAQLSATRAHLPEKRLTLSTVARGLPRRPEKTLSTLLTQLSAMRAHLPEKRLTFPGSPEACRAAPEEALIALLAQLSAMRHLPEKRLTPFPVTTGFPRPQCGCIAQSNAVPFVGRRRANAVVREAKGRWRGLARGAGLPAAMRRHPDRRRARR